MNIRFLSISHFLTLLLLASTVLAQTPTPTPSPVPASTTQDTRLAKESQEIKEKVAKIGVRQNVTVNRRDRKEFHGFISTIEDRSFTVAEIDLKTSIEFPYDQVKNVRKGYGEKNLFTGKRGGPRKAWVGWALGLGIALGVPIVLLAVANKQGF